MPSAAPRRMRTRPVSQPSAPRSTSCAMGSIPASSWRMVERFSSSSASGAYCQSFAIASSRSRALASGSLRRRRSIAMSASSGRSAQTAIAIVAPHSCTIATSASESTIATRIAASATLATVLTRSWRSPSPRSHRAAARRRAPSIGSVSGASSSGPICGTSAP